jgi:hypothetical protein
MKTLTIALILAGLIVVPAFTQSATAAPQNDRRDTGQSAQASGTYAGYPLVPARPLVDSLSVSDWGSLRSMPTSRAAGSG